MSFSCVQASLEELAVDESDTQPAMIIFYSNLPITCQQVVVGNPINCWITFEISSSDDIAVRQHNLPTKTACRYQLREIDWKADEGYAYESSRSLDIVAKVKIPRIYSSTAEPAHHCLCVSAKKVIFLSEYVLLIRSISERRVSQDKIATRFGCDRRLRFSSDADNVRLTNVCIIINIIIVIFWPTSTKPVGTKTLNIWNNNCYYHFIISLLLILLILKISQHFAKLWDRVVCPFHSRNIS